MSKLIDTDSWLREALIDTDSWLREAAKAPPPETMDRAGSGGREVAVGETHYWEKGTHAHCHVRITEILKDSRGQVWVRARAHDDAEHERDQRKHMGMLREPMHEGGHLNSLERFMEAVFGEVVPERTGDFLIKLWPLHGGGFAALEKRGANRHKTRDAKVVAIAEKALLEHAPFVVLPLTYGIVTYTLRVMPPSLIPVVMPEPSLGVGPEIGIKR